MPSPDPERLVGAFGTPAELEAATLSGPDALHGGTLPTLASALRARAASGTGTLSAAGALWGSSSVTAGTEDALMSANFGGSLRVTGGADSLAFGEVTCGAAAGVRGAAIPINV